MTSEQVIKDLQSVMEWFEKHGRNTNTAVIGIAGNAVELIEAQEAEIKRLHKVHETEMKRVFNNHKELMQYYRSELIREFAGRLKATITINNTTDGYLDYAIDYNCLIEDIDNLVTEMTEGKDNA